MVIVKPLALWLSIQLDADSGLAIAQIYLIGLLFLSLSGTNAHRSFYQIYFGNKDFILKVPNSSANMDIKLGNQIGVSWNSFDARALDPK